MEKFQYSSGTTNINGDASVALVFTITHASGAGTAGDYVIAADLHAYGNKVEQHKASIEWKPLKLVMNTGTFEGSVTYVQMNTVSNQDNGAGLIRPS